MRPQSGVLSADVDWSLWLPPPQISGIAFLEPNRLIMDHTSATLKTDVYGKGGGQMGHRDL